MAGFTFDAGALIALDRGDRRIGLMLARTDELKADVTLPATALAQVVRNPRQQVTLMRLARQATTHVVPLDRDDAVIVGRLLAATGTSDIADAHVVVCARRAGQPVVTTDPDDLVALEPQLTVIAL
jgi:predicted nucleic acid-binding protein